MRAAPRRLAAGICREDKRGLTMRNRLYLVLALAALAVVAGLSCSSDNGTGPVLTDSIVEPDVADVEVSSSQQFTVDLDVKSAEVLWYVDDVLGGTPQTGMITPEGLFIAPAEVPVGGSVTVTAITPADTLDDGSAEVTITKQAQSSYVEITPGMSTVAVYDSVEFAYSSPGCDAPQLVAGDPTWTVEIISGSSLDAGVLRGRGAYVAPTRPDEDLELMIMASSDGCPGKTGIAKITVKKPLHFLVELEEFTASDGEGIRPGVACGGGEGVQGLDKSGEWIEIPISVKAGGRYNGYIRYASGRGDSLRLSVKVDGGGPGGTSPVVPILIAHGTGVGG
jgi:hypothetical protein